MSNRIVSNSTFAVNSNLEQVVEISNTTAIPVASTSNITKWGGADTTLGEKTMVASVPVVIASDQTAINVNVDNSPNSGSEGNLDFGTVVLADQFSNEVDVSDLKNLTITGTTTDATFGAIEIYTAHHALGTKYKVSYDIYPDGSGNFYENFSGVAFNRILLKYKAPGTVTATVLGN